MKGGGLSLVLLLQTLVFLHQTLLLDLQLGLTQPGGPFLALLFQLGTEMHQGGGLAGQGLFYLLYFAAVAFLVSTALLQLLLQLLLKVLLLTQLLIGLLHLRQSLFYSRSLLPLGPLKGFLLCFHLRLHVLLPLLHFFLCFKGVTQATVQLYQLGTKDFDGTLLLFKTKLLLFQALQPFAGLGSTVAMGVALSPAKGTGQIGRASCRERV